MLNTPEKYIDVGIPFSYWDKEIEVVCPKCRSTALVHRTDIEAKCVCSSCGKVEQKTLMQSEYTFSTRRTGQVEVDPFFNHKLALNEPSSKGNIWVYNADQLNHLKSYISARLREKKEIDEYFSYYISYFHKLPAWIKSSKHRDTVLKKIAILEKKAITKPNNKNPLDIIKDKRESFLYRWNNRAWKYLDQSNFTKGNYGIIYFPNFEEKSVTIRKIKNDKLVVSKAYIVNGNIAVERELMEELALRHTTKGSTFRHTKSGKATTYYSINIRKLNNEKFTVKELLIDVANMTIDEARAISINAVNFKENDYIFMFTESKSPHPDFAPTSKDETRIFYGFSKGAITKILGAFI
ncbi:MAG: hypothetical protein KAG56_10730 [Sulfurovaceae bacterium]|nr:hypothetical protein [Sulfurovaceae bacterium]